METIRFVLFAYGDMIFKAVLYAAIGVLAYIAKNIYARYINDSTKRAVAHDVVQFVEQVWKDIHGKAKLAKALETAEALLKKKGIPFDADEMLVRIEAAVAEFNNAFHQPLAIPETAESVRKVYDDEKVESGLLD